jgi:hypothetical protein
MIKIRDGRGLHNSDQGKKNRELIKEYFKKNPDATKTRCANDLGFTITTVMKHVKCILGNQS